MIYANLNFLKIASLIQLQIHLNNYVVNFMML